MDLRRNTVKVANDLGVSADTLRRELGGKGMYSDADIAHAAERIREKRKPYACDVCGRRYINPASLRLHRWERHAL